ncbi:hypothetical protein DFJ58DRAFT_910858 [Suillus subalutaceus]|uniref:uncharacterized protein n=1 Tax=Suillus subalutaceus TaxID=48586 RepID=UPI001B8705F5|nr:uncharacterized protein DFJ58DRAFT_910858 [Suillus subalutaceus]KAG1871213.1 hypothetical protein DFJ58DRAFT_910858 [Suillus subalutaceus]
MCTKNYETVVISILHELCISDDIENHGKAAFLLLCSPGGHNDQTIFCNLAHLSVGMMNDSEGSANDFNARFTSDHLGLKAILDSAGPLHLCNINFVDNDFLTTRAISMTNLTAFEESQSLLIAFSFIARAVCDWITTAGIACHSMITMIDRLIYWTIETALVTSDGVGKDFTISLNEASSLTSFKFLVLKQNFVGNSLLASLNRRSLLRETWRAPRSDTRSHGGSLCTTVFRAGATQPQAESRASENFNDRDLQV